MVVVIRWAAHLLVSLPILCGVVALWLAALLNRAESMHMNPRGLVTRGLQSLPLTIAKRVVMAIKRFLLGHAGWAVCLSMAVSI